MHRNTKSESGMVTVEFAVALPAIIAVTLLVAGVGGASAMQVATCDAARVAARSAAIGADTPGFDKGISVSVSQSDQWVRADAQADLPGWVPQLTCSATALREPL